MKGFTVVFTAGISGVLAALLTLKRQRPALAGRSRWLR
jgi:hypothetical protein